MQSRACWRLVGRPEALAPGATEGVWSALVHYRRLRRLMAVASGALIVAVTFALLERMIDWGLATRLPDLPPLPIADAFSDFSRSW